LNGITRGLTQNQAHTAPDSPDRRLRGRTYAIPFDAVWNASLSLAQGGIRGWSVVSSDDEEGVIVAESKTLIWRFIDDVVITIGLDENAQTRVDARSQSRVGNADLGRNPRTLRSFFRKLDRALSAQPGQILDATRSLQDVAE